MTHVPRKARVTDRNLDRKSGVRGTGVLSRPSDHKRLPKKWLVSLCLRKSWVVSVGVGKEASVVSVSKAVTYRLSWIFLLQSKILLPKMFCRYTSKDKQKFLI